MRIKIVVRMMPEVADVGVTVFKQSDSLQSTFTALLARIPGKLCHHGESE